MSTSQEKTLARKTDRTDFIQEPLAHLAEGPKNLMVLYGKFIFQYFLSD